MNWQYLEIRFRFTFAPKTIERKRFFGRVVQAYDTPEEIEWQITETGGGKEDILVKGTAKRRMSFVTFNTAQYGVRSTTWEYTAFCDFKTVCFQYIQRLGAQGWELHGALPENFTKASYGSQPIIGYIIDVRDQPYRDNDFSIGSWIGQTIDLWNASFFFKRQQNTKRVD